jgi:hypothetical protein
MTTLGEQVPNNNYEWQFQKEWLVLLPLLGSTLALTFDVGYFTALQINFFSFFSISEHIVFALEVLPAAIAASISIIAIPFSVRMGRARRERRKAKEIKTGKRMPFYKDVMLWLLVLWICVGLFWLWRTSSLSG